ncbi:MAG: DUF523 domain-containing protein [Halioglobus sp.]
MNKILVSACLLGKRVRYDGRALTVTEHILKEWIRSGRVVSICPEVDAGMPIPRPAAEISGGDGYAVLAQKGRVITSTGADVTDYFRSGAQQALALCKEHHIKIAVLSEASPSCGSSVIYDGSFSRTKNAGVGVTTALLRKNEIRVFSQHEISAAQAALANQ